MPAYTCSSNNSPRQIPRECSSPDKGYARSIRQEHHAAEPLLEPPRFIDMPGSRSKVIVLLAHAYLERAHCPGI